MISKADHLEWWWLRTLSNSGLLFIMWYRHMLNASLNVKIYHVCLICPYASLYHIGNCMSEASCLLWIQLQVFPVSLMVFRTQCLFPRSIVSESTVVGKDCLPAYDLVLLGGFYLQDMTYVQRARGFLLPTLHTHSLKKFLLWKNSLASRIMHCSLNAFV